MSQSKIKTYRKFVKKEHDKNVSDTVKKTFDYIYSRPLKERMKIAYRILKGKKANG